MGVVGTSLNECQHGTPRFDGAPDKLPQSNIAFTCPSLLSCITHASHTVHAPHCLASKFPSFCGMAVIKAVSATIIHEFMQSHRSFDFLAPAQPLGRSCKRFNNAAMEGHDEGCSSCSNLQNFHRIQRHSHLPLVYSIRAPVHV